jgi:hypothetical protein
MLQLLLYRWLYIDPVPSTSSSRSQPKRSRSGGTNNNAGGRVNRLRHQARSCLDFGTKSTLPPSMGPALTCLLLDFPVSVPRLHPTTSFGSTIAWVVMDAVVHSTGVCLSALVQPNSNSRSNSSSAARTRRMQRLEAEVGILVKSIIGWLTGSAIRPLLQLDLLSNVARKLAAASFWSDSTGETSSVSYPKLVLDVQDQPRQQQLEQPKDCHAISNAALLIYAEDGPEVSHPRAGKPSAAIPPSPLLSRAFSPSISAPICREEVRRHPLTEWTNHRGGEPATFKA